MDPNKKSGELVNHEEVGSESVNSGADTSENLNPHPDGVLVDLEDAQDDARPDGVQDILEVLTPDNTMVAISSEEWPVDNVLCFDSDDNGEGSDVVPKATPAASLSDPTPCSSESGDAFATTADGETNIEGESEHETSASEETPVAPELAPKSDDDRDSSDDTESKPHSDETTVSGQPEEAVATEEEETKGPPPPPSLIPESEPTPEEIIQELDAMVGLKHVRAHFLKLKARVEIARFQNIDLGKEKFSIALRGNPGTGKTTVARLYAKFLRSLKIVPGKGYKELAAMKLVHVEDLKGTARVLADLGDNEGGVVFIDEAHQMTEYSGDLQHLLSEIEAYQGKIIFIFAGYNDEMDNFLGFNPSVRNRIPNSIKFEDYSNKELLHMFANLIEMKFEKKMKVEGGLYGLYTRILVNRVAGSRGTASFGNGSAVQAALSTVCERQADRIRRDGLEGNDSHFLFTKEDLIGPPPEDALSKSKAWKELQEMVGLDDILSSIRTFFHRIHVNHQRELEEKPPIQVGLNRVFLGPPGTGKTTVGKLYAQVLADIGLLSTSEVMIRNPSDLIGKYIGHSEANTKSVLEASKGKVLIIDEAHTLYPGSRSGGCNKTDVFRVAIIDTLVSEIQNTPGEDRCVILMGYTDQMLNMFSHSNPGLARRFPLEDAFDFPSFSVDQLGEILDQKVKKQELEMTPLAREIAVHMLTLSRDRPNFGNGGEVENILTRAKISQQKRNLSSEKSHILLEPQDFDKNYERILTKGESCRELFKDVIGQENIIAQFEGYQSIVKGMRKYNVDPRPHIPFTYIFSGQPGTGKTTTARKIGQVFYNMGFLSTADVLECSVSDLVAEYHGQTGPKVINLLEQALGKVLFIDEAYRLASGSSYCEEAVSELVDCITKSRYANKIVIILAGYTEDMNHLLRVNRGLSSRFPTAINFPSLPPEQSLELLKCKIGELGIWIEGLEEGDDRVRRGMVIAQIWLDLANTEGWANGRDVETLAKTVIGETFKFWAGMERTGELTVSYSKLVTIMREMLGERRRRS